MSTSSVLQRYLSEASAAAIAAGQLLRRHVGHPRRITIKRSAVDLVTEVDQASERLIYQKLHRVEPRFGFLGEEQGVRQADAIGRWIVDPLDGTMNFVHGLPLFGVSIGLELEGRMVVGVIYDPMRQELFAARAGKGARLNGRLMRVAPTRRLSHSLLATGFSSKAIARPQQSLRWFLNASRTSHGVRRIGSTVWCLAAVAAGRLEGFYENDLWPWDIAAGLLLVQEAGGRVTDLSGHPPQLGRSQLVATNGFIHAELLSALSR